jgi:hypothetical protein
MVDSGKRMVKWVNQRTKAVSLRPSIRRLIFKYELLKTKSLLV